MGDLQVSMANPILKWSNLGHYLGYPHDLGNLGGMGGGQVYTVQGCAGMERQTADLLHLSVSHHVSRSFLGYNKQQKIWVCLKMGYTPNYSHLIGIMIINHWV